MTSACRRETQRRASEGNRRPHTYDINKLIKLQLIIFEHTPTKTNRVKACFPVVHDRFRPPTTVSTKTLYIPPYTNDYSTFVRVRIKRHVFDIGTGIFKHDARPNFVVHHSDLPLYISFPLVTLLCLLFCSRCHANYVRTSPSF